MSTTYYTIGQVAEIFSIPASTLRYYDKEGLFPDLERVSGIRRFSEADLEALRVIECLKGSGLEIKDIKHFMAMCQEGPSTFAQRKALFESRRAALNEELERIQKTLSMIEFKCWYYEQAIADGTDEGVQAMMPDKLPEGVQELYDRAHQ